MALLKYWNGTQWVSLSMTVPAPEVYSQGTDPGTNTVGAIWIDTDDPPPASVLAPVVEMVTTLPASPYDKQEVDLVVDDAGTYLGPVVWRCKYRAATAGANKWHVIGSGPGLWIRDTSGCTRTLATTGDSQTGTSGPAITIPNAGIWDFVAEAEVQLAAAVGAWGGVNITLNNTLPQSSNDDEERALVYTNAAAVLYGTAVSHRRVTVQNAGDIARIAYKANGTNAATFAQRRLMAMPVRIR